MGLATTCFNLCWEWPSDPALGPDRASAFPFRISLLFPPCSIQDRQRGYQPLWRLQSLTCSLSSQDSLIAIPYALSQALVEMRAAGQLAPTGSLLFGGWMGWPVANSAGLPTGSSRGRNLMTSWWRAAWLSLPPG